MSVLPPFYFPQLAWSPAVPSAPVSPPQMDMDLEPVPALVDSGETETDSATSSPTSSLGSLRDFAAAGMHPAAHEDAESEVFVPILPAARGSLGHLGHQRAFPHPPRVATFRIDPTPPWSASSQASSPLVECWDWDASGPKPVKPAPPCPTQCGPVVTLTSPGQAGGSCWAPEQTRVLHNPMRVFPPTLPFRTPEAQRGQAAPPSRLSIAMRRAVQRRLSLSSSSEPDSSAVPSHDPPAPLSPPQIIITRPDGLAGPPVGLGLGLDFEDAGAAQPQPRSVQGCAAELPIPTVTITPPGQAPAVEAYDVCSLTDPEVAHASAGQPPALDRFKGETFEDDTAVDVDVARELAFGPHHWGEEATMELDYRFSFPEAEGEADDEHSPSPTQTCFPMRPRTSHKRLAGRQMVQRLGLRAGVPY